MIRKRLHYLFLFVPLYIFVLFFDHWFWLFWAWYDQAGFYIDAYRFSHQHRPFLYIFFDYLDPLSILIAGPISEVGIRINKNKKFFLLPIMAFLATILKILSEPKKIFFSHIYSSQEISYKLIIFFFGILILTSLLMPMARKLFQPKS